MKRFAFATIFSAAMLLPIYAQTPAGPGDSKDPSHNPATAKTEGGARTYRQQDRIAAGEKSGNLKPAAAANLEKREAGINKTRANMRNANGGKLTSADRANINARQNKVSQSIKARKADGAADKK